ncbi:hypothetical protein Dsin_023775 [Dipteronia sinensis]|uniref:Uncharacterized protein n=1 Tax=Dipteronia sinensis TaxID=43782 RepID=A0AAE0A4J7_9ROSI|nr:hypothetical protein Dsin_023775 [Dipteronia sinensis]
MKSVLQRKKTNGKLCYGIATLKGLYIFNGDDYFNNNDKVPNKKEEGNQAQRMEEGDSDDDVNNNDKIPNEKEEGDQAQPIKEGGVDDEKKNPLAKYRIKPTDFIHAFCSWLVFVVYAMCSSDVMRCFYPHPSDNVNVLIMNLPLAVGGAVSFIFMLFPTNRRGIGYADKGTEKKS